MLETFTKGTSGKKIFPGVEERMKEMKSQLKWLATAMCAAVLSAYAWADIQVDNVAALSGLAANGGTYSFVQFRLDDQCFTVTGAEALGDVVWVKSIGVVQRPGSGNTIAANSTLRIQQSTAEYASGISSTQNAAEIAISQPLSSSSAATLTVGTASQTLRTYTFAAPFPLKKSTLYTAKFYNASGNSISPQLAMYNDSTNQTTQNTNTSIHANDSPNFSPCVRIIAVERSKLAEVGASANWSGLWPEAPTETDTVGLNVTAANAALTMDTPATVAGLAIGSETAVGPLTLTGSGLTSTTTSIATDTDVSAITASLGALSIGPGKTLTVGDKGAFTSLTGTGGTLALDATDASISYINTEAELEALRTYNGKVIFKGTNAKAETSTAATGVTLPYTIGKGTMSAKFAFDGGTHNFQYGVDTDERLFGPQGTNDDPTLEVKNGATLNFCTKDLSGWNSQTNAEKVILRVREGGTLNFVQSGTSTTYFNNRLVLDNGARVTAADMGEKFRLNGGVRTETTAQLAMLGGETPTAASVKGGKITLAGDSAKGVGVSVGANATLTIENEIAGDSDRTFAKYGAGTLVLSGAFAGSPITVNAGTLDFAVTEGNRTIAVAISGAGTVKKSGAGTLALTGTVSTPVEVAAGTLNLGTQRPTLGAVAEGAILKLTATAAEVVEGAVELPTTLLAAPDKARFSVVNGSGNAQEISSVSLTEGRLTLTLRVAEPTFTVTDENNGNWAGATEWPSSGNVSIAANQLTADKTVTIPAPAEGTRALTQVTVVGNDTAKVTLVVESGVTIETLVPYGYVRVDVATVNALTNAPSVPESATLEVVADSSATLSKDISGAGKFAKGGSGVLTLGANITIATTGGSIVQSGTLKFAAINNDTIITGAITTKNTPGNYTSNAMGDVRVCANAVLDLNGRKDLWLRTITLAEGATYKNGSSTAVGDSSRQLRAIVLEGDATVEAGADFGLVAGGYAETTLMLNGHTLTKKGVANFWLGHTTATNGILLATNGKFSGSSSNWQGQSNASVSLSDVTLRCDVAADAAEGSGIDLSASTVTVPANKTLTTEVADDKTASIPFNTLTLNGTLTANCDVSANALTTNGAKTLAGTGTVTVPDMSLGGALNVTGNLVIDRTGQEPRTFNNAIKVASGGSLTTNGEITWGSNSNEFLGSLTVASGTLSIKTPGQKLGGNITIAHGATLTHAVKTAEMDKLDFAHPATIKVYGTLDMCQQRWTMRTHNKLYVYPGATVTGSGDETYGAFDAEAGQANTISFCAADANSGSGEITFASNLRARANWTLDVAEGVTVNLTGVRAQTTENGGTGDYKDNYAIAKTGAGKLIVNSNFRLNGVCEGLIEVAAEKTLTLSGTVTHTAAFSGSGKILVTNDLTSTDTPASAVTLNGTLGTVTGEDESAQASCALALEVASGSTLTLNNTVATTLSKALTGAGKVVIGDGTSATKVTQAAVGCDISAIDIAAGATYTVSTAGMAGSGTVMLPATTTVTVAGGGKLVVDTTRQMNANVTGAGEVEVTAVAKYVFAADQTNRLAPGKLTLKSGLVLYAARDNDTGLSVNELTLENATLSMELAKSVTTKPVVTVAANQVLSGEGAIEAPIVFEAGAIFDAKNSVAGGSLSLAGKDTSITWPESGTVTVRATEPVQLLVFATEALKYFTLEASAIDQGLYLSEATGFVGTDVTMSVLKKLGTDSLPAAISENDAVKTAIQKELDALAGKGYIITKVTDITTQSTVGEVKGSAQAVDCFTNLETTLVLNPDWEGGFSTTATAVVTYDFGVSQITVKKAKLDGDAAAQSYVLACAKVSNGKAEKATAADYAKGTTVSLLLDGNEASGAVALDTATLSDKFGLTAGLGEQWFALPMKNLKLGTRKFTVHATNTPQAEVTP